MSLIRAPEAIEKLLQGHLVALPTETVYGLAARIDDEAALRRIFETKQRPFFDPLIVHVFDREQVRDLVEEWPAPYEALCAELWPGPLTVIAKKSDRISSLITAGLPSVGLRCPRHPMALYILEGVGVPLAAPSANRFKRTSPTEAAHVSAEFGDAVSVVNGGRSEVGVESTVIEAEELNGGRWRIHVLRPGGVSRAEIAKVLEARDFDFEIVRSTSGTAPGQLKAHYQPANPVVIVPEYINNNSLYALLAERFSDSAIFELELSSEPGPAARELYAELHRHSRFPGVIVVRPEKLSPFAEWEVIWDRLTRAASLDLR